MIAVNGILILVSLIASIGVRKGPREAGTAEVEMRLIYMALLVLAGSYAPLLVIGALDPTANPIGPGLLAMLGTVVASLMVAWAALRAVVRAGR